MIEEAYLRRRPQHRSLLSQQRRHARYAVRVSSHQCRSWGGDLNRSMQHQLLILLDKEVSDGDVTDIVHGVIEPQKE